jgi:hypothetical protein
MKNWQSIAGQGEPLTELFMGQLPQCKITDQLSTECSANVVGSIFRHVKANLTGLPTLYLWDPY